MKSFIYLICGLVIFTNTIFATVRTVSNYSSTPAQYLTVQSAINGSTDGDTIYINGSPNSYGDFTIDRKLVIIGAGYDVSGTDYNFNSIVGQIIFDSVFNHSVAGTQLIGLRVNSSIYYASGDNGNIHNITIKRCLLNSYLYISGNNWLIINNIINSYAIYLNNFSNTVIANNILYELYLNNSNQSSVYIMNNLFLYSSSYFFSSVSNANVFNNILYAIDLITSSSNNNVFNNNLIYTNATNFTLPPAGNSGTGNFQQQDPLFMDQSTIPSPGQSQIAYNLLKNYNWQLQATSPGKNAGTDGTDLGIFGGPYPWPGFTGMPNIPVIQSFYLKNPVLKNTDQLKIVIKATKHD